MFFPWLQKCPGGIWIRSGRIRYDLVIRIRNSGLLILGSGPVFRLLIRGSGSDRNIYEPGSLDLRNSELFSFHFLQILSCLFSTSVFFLFTFLLIRTSEGVEKQEGAPQEVSVLTREDNPELEEEEDRNLTVVHSMEIQNLIIQALLSIRND
jgi:hypothetical protein